LPGDALPAAAYAASERMLNFVGAIDATMNANASSQGPDYKPKQAAHLK